MPTTYRVLGQAAPAAETDTTVYTVLTGRQTIVSSIVVANRGSDGTTFRVAVRPNGSALSNEHYIAYDVAIARNDTKVLSFGVTLNDDDLIAVYAGNANLSFNIYGTEITA
jgi:hypothetical protein